jgi:hypothetical protein
MLFSGVIIASCMYPLPETSFDPPASEVYDGTEIAILCDNCEEEYEIYYTMDGTEPNIEEGGSTIKYDSNNKPVIYEENAPVTITALTYLPKRDFSGPISEATYIIDSSN